MKNEASSWSMIHHSPVTCCEGVLYTQSFLHILKAVFKKGVFSVVSDKIKNASVPPKSFSDWEGFLPFPAGVSVSAKH